MSMLVALVIWIIFSHLASIQGRFRAQTIIPAQEVACSVLETNLTCSGTGPLTRENVEAPGTYSTYTSAKLEEGITVIEESAFASCSKLAFIDYPSSLTTMEHLCFQGCAFETFHIKRTLINIMATCWNSNSKLKTFTVDSNHPAGYKTSNGFLMNGTDIMCVGGGVAKTGATEAERTITFPSCTKILTSAVRWNDCWAIVIHNDTVEIQAMAFYYCDQMTKITLGTKLSTWSETAISCCFAVKIINLNGNENFYFADNTFGKKDSNGNEESILWMAETVTSLTIPTTVKVIGRTVLQAVTRLTNVSVASGHTTFRVTCSNKLVVDKDTDSTTFNRARFCVGGATSITIPSSVTEIYSNCFRHCPLLTKVVLHADVTTFHSDIFRQCPNLTTIDFKGCKVLDSKGVAKLPNNLATASNKLATVLNWPSKNSWKMDMDAFASCGFTSLSLPTTCIEITDGGFRSCASLETVTVPNTMTCIGRQAFHNCKKLKSITFTAVSTLKTIGHLAFASCTSLTTVTLPWSITSLAGSSFSNCKNLASINFNYNNGTYRSDGTAAYKNSGSKQYHTLVIWPAGLTSFTPNAETEVIATHAFYGCTGLIDITVNTERLDTSAFISCENLQYIRFTGNVKELANSVVVDCKALKGILYCSSSDAVTYVGDPFPTNPDVYLLDDFLGSPDECTFCGHICFPILDHSCNIPTVYFTDQYRLVYQHRLNKLHLATVLLCMYEVKY